MCCDYLACIIVLLKKCYMSRTVFKAKGSYNANSLSKSTIPYSILDICFFLLQRNPEISHILNNPDMMRQVKRLDSDNFL